VTTTQRVAIVGAGFAGLSAARELAGTDCTIDLIEARDRVGGRANTVVDPGADLPVELGPEYVHGLPEVTVALARAARFTIEPIRETHYLAHRGRLVETGDIWTRFGRLLKGAPAADRDESARTYLDRTRVSERDAKLFAMLVEGFYAAPLDDISIASVAADASGVGEDDVKQFRLRQGYGELARWMAAELPRDQVKLHPGCVVRTIDWRSDRIRIELVCERSAQTIEVDRAIITLPIGVLRGGGVRFTPVLQDHARALAQLEMGQVVKLVVCLREPVWHELGLYGLAFAHGEGTAFPTFWLRTRGSSTQLTAWAGGPHAMALAGQTGAQLVERAIDEFAKTTGHARGRLATLVRHHHFHDYASDPFARGAYSYTRVGGHRAAEQLSRPLDDRLFFAGEATDAEYEGSVAGALASGVRAAREVIATQHRVRRFLMRMIG
jgi:monoamine oxidase